MIAVDSQTEAIWYIDNSIIKSNPSGKNPEGVVDLLICVAAL